MTDAEGMSGSGGDIPGASGSGTQGGGTGGGLPHNNGLPGADDLQSRHELTREARAADAERAATRDTSANVLPGPLQMMARGAWQAVLVIGLSAVVLGIVVLAWPHATLAVVGILFGLYLLIAGILQLVAAFGTHTDTSLRVLAFISGAISIALGLFCFRGRLESILLLAIWIGIAWLFRGISQLAAAASDPLMPARGWQIFAAVIGIIAGIVVLSSPLTSIWVLILFSGIWLIVTGVVEIVTAFRIRGHAKHLPQGA